MVFVFVPSHITGFFSIFDNDDLLIKGSLGVGILLDKGVITEIVQLNKLSDNLNSHFDDKISILINGKVDIRNQNIILKTISLMLDDLDDFSLKFSEFQKSDKFIQINQTIEVPIGCGFGTSAAAAIGTAICLNEFFNIGLSLDECGKYAHLAEVALGSGLGDVIAEMSSGIVRRVKPGAPGTGEVLSIDLNEELYVLTKTFDEIETASIIEDSNHKNIITEVGENSYNEFLKDESPKKFMNLSLDFAKETNLISEDILAISNEFADKTLGVSMAMLGNTAFALMTKDQKLAIEDENLDDFEIYKLETDGIKILK